MNKIIIHDYYYENNINSYNNNMKAEIDTFGINSALSKILIKNQKTC